MLLRDYRVICEELRATSNALIEDSLVLREVSNSLREERIKHATRARARRPAVTHLPAPDTDGC